MLDLKKGAPRSLDTSASRLRVQETGKRQIAIRTAGRTIRDISIKEEPQFPESTSHSWIELSPTVYIPDSDVKVTAKIHAYLNEDISTLGKRETFGEAERSLPDVDFKTECKTKTTDYSGVVQPSQLCPRASGGTKPNTFHQTNRNRSKIIGTQKRAVCAAHGYNSSSKLRTPRRASTWIR